jgi:lysophospholipase L1-like esterase
MNIVLFGDSHLGRFGKNPTEKLEKLIDNSVVYNCSAGGFTSTDGAKRAELIGTLKPDVVIFSYGGNDVAPWKPIVRKEEYLQNMRKIFEAFPNSAKILLISPDVKLADPLQTDEFNTSLHEYHDAQVSLCNELNVTVISGNEVVRPLGNDYHEDDGVHMNDAAYIRVIEAFAGTIKSF